MKISELAGQQSADTQELLDELDLVIQALQAVPADNSAALQAKIDELELDDEQAEAIMAASDDAVKAGIAKAVAALQPKQDEPQA